MFAAQACEDRWGSPLNIGEFAPTCGDIAIDSRLGIHRTWTGDTWHPGMYSGPRDHACLGPQTNYGRLIDDAGLPVGTVSQEEALLTRGYKDWPR